MSDPLIDAYDQGWTDGYNDELATNPYPENSDEYIEWELGYEQGTRDC